MYIFGFHYLVQNVLRIGIEKSGLALGGAVTLILTTIINLAICTVLSVLWGKVKAKILKKG